MPRSQKNPVVPEQEDSPEGPEELFRALAATEESDEPETDAELEEPEEELEPEEEPSPPEEDVREQLRRLQQRVGTEDDVSAVKSQRDRLRNELEEYRAQVEPHIQELAQRLEQLEQGQVQSQYQRWEAQWQGYIDAAPDTPTRQERMQQFAQARQTAQREMALYQRQQELAKREQNLQQTDTQKAQQSLIDFVTGFYDEVGKKLGMDVTKLNKDSYSGLRQSFDEQLEQVTRLRQQAPRKLPTRPQRGGRTSAPKDVTGWFDNLIGKKDYQTIEEAFRVMKESQGVKLEDIISR